MCPRAPWGVHGRSLQCPFVQTYKCMTRDTRRNQGCRGTWRETEGRGEMRRVEEEQIVIKCWKMISIIP